MRREYDLNSLNITKQNRSEYRNIVNSKMNYFVPANFRKSNQISVLINYESENLMAFEALKQNNEIFKLQCALSLIELIEQTNPLFALQIKPENLYFDQASKAYQLERIKDNKRLSEQEYILKVNAFIGALFTKNSFTNLLAENNSLLNKVKVLNGLNNCQTLGELKEVISNRISELMYEQNEKQITVAKNYYKKNQLYSRIKWLIIISTLSIIIFLTTVYIPNRNAQLKAYTSYNQKIYEDVISDLKATDKRSMTPLTKYILSESAVRLSPLSSAQKENILTNLTPNVNEGSLDFWVDLAQGDIDGAYEQSITNNDAQQKAFALLIYIDQIQNDPKLSATKKQEQISTYKGELDKINENMQKEQETKENK